MAASVRRVLEACARHGIATGLAITAAVAAPPVYLTLESLLQKGWEVAGYAGTADNRSSLLLLKKAGEMYLVQCSTFHDVTRTPRVSTNCYELR
jgi:hypothetical protein